MKQGLRTPLSLAIFLLGTLSLVSFSGSRYIVVVDAKSGMLGDTNDPDSTLPYPFDSEEGGLYGNNPKNFTEEVEYDPETGQYIVTQKVGGLVTKPPMLMTPEEYREYVSKKQASEYWERKTQSAEAARAEGRDPESSLIPQIQVNSEIFNKLFGSNTIDIRPQGYAELRFGGRLQKVDNPLIPERNRSTFTFDFDQRIQMNVTGKIGDRLELKTNYDTEATFSFENQMKVEYNGDEDAIVKKIELGNVSLPLNSTLISGSQSLFGVKGQFQFGKLMLTGVFSEQRSQSSSINVQGGATTTNFEIWGDQYEANRHYFLSHYFRDHYEEFLRNIPLITSPVQITKVEVWVTNTRQSTEDTRNLVAFMDLGEQEKNAYRDANRPGPDIFGRLTPYQGFPDNANNELDPEVLERQYPGVRDIGQVNSALNSAGFDEAIEYVELSNARKLRPTEFDYHPQLGYISLNTSLNQDEVLAVAFQFTAGGKTYQVGEFSTDGVTPPKNLVVKMLKSTILNVKAPMWDLMMKNVYSLSAFQVNREDFRLEVLYRNDETGTPIPFIPEGDLSDQLLLRVMELDRLNNNNDPTPDGFFDFVQGVTIKPQNGRIFFPVLEPFGSNLERKINDPDLRDKYVFNDLYDSTRFKAQNQTQLNKFLLRGQYKSSSSSEISLNAFNIPPGSVVVTAGGTKLVENVDYTVDYNLGRVKIINDGILNSGIPIKVDFENNALFNFQTRSFMGVNADYRFNDNLNLGGSIVRLSERPLTQKVNIGEEPIANTIVGLNGSYSDEAPYLTRLVDAIPFIDTKEKSTLTVNGEVAHFIPGSPRGINIDGAETTYLDDFESSQTSIDIKNPSAWRLASTPAGQSDLFPESDRDDISYGFNRAKLAWYTIDPLFHNDQANTPDNIRNNKDLQSKPFTRRVYVEEVFPNLQLQPNQPPNIAVLDLAFYPRERGPYNYDVEPTQVSSGINDEGQLEDPQSRWGGVMRDLTTTNFEEQNIEFIQFWVMDPYYGNEKEAPDGDGYLYFNLGSVSEDILKDGSLAVENGIPADGNLQKLDTSRWGYVPNVRPVVTAFDNDPAARNRQDVGYDLLDDDQERGWDAGTFLPYVQRIENTYGQSSGAYQKAVNDPSADNFQYYRGPALDQASADILERYKDFNNPQGNSDPTQINGISAFATNMPDIEDLNRDQTLSKTEAYYQYRVSMKKDDLDEVGQNYITDIRTTKSGQLPNGKTVDVRWIQFKVPVFSPEKKVGPINDFRSIRFIRMFTRGWQTPVVMRFAKLELVRGEWRRYTQNLDLFGDELNTDNGDNTLFEVNAVNIEQNGSRQPIPYKLPPGINRQVLFGTTAATAQNEQSLSMRVCNLKDGAARAVFRNLDFDMRLYKELKMFVHAEDGNQDQSAPALKDDEISIFIRMGSDYNQNYYEYELPLKLTEFNSTLATEIWPEANNINLPLEVLREVKLERDRVFRSQGEVLTQKYTVKRDRATVTVVGAPNLGNVRTIMIGVRNPKSRTEAGEPVCAEVWVNELRLTEFAQKGGWAATARVAAQMADFANVSVSGRMSTIGWGSIDQNVQERQQENQYAYDLQSSFELGKFFSPDANLRIPMYFGTSEQWANPQFNPLDPDITFDDALGNLEDPGAQAELRRITQDYSRRTSLNFTNVRKDRKGAGTPKPWDIENFSATFSYSDAFRRNISIEREQRRDYSGNLNYSFRTNPKAVEPFKKVSWMQNDYLELLRDINFNWYPRNVTVIGGFNRSWTALKMRNTAYPGDSRFDLPETYNKNFTLNRQYSVLWDFTQNLKLDYNARMRSRVDELDGAPDTDSNIAYVKDRLKELGRPTNFHQSINLNWQLPINKLPFFDFVQSQARYTADYDWAANSLRAQQTLENDASGLNFGNTIQNNRNIQFNNTLNLVTLYNEIPYLEKINKGAGGNQRDRRGLRTPGLNRRRGGQEEEKEEEEEEPSVFDKILSNTARVLMMVRNVTGNYTQSEGTMLPGFSPQPTIFGLATDDGNAPGIGFVLGDQRDIRDIAARNGWLEQTELLSTQYTTTRSENINLRATLEPYNNIRLILTSQRQETFNHAEFFRYNDEAQSPYDSLGWWESQNPFETRTFTTTFFSLPTAFESLKAPGYSSEAYQNFLNFREEFSRRRAEEFANSELGQQLGYTVPAAPTGNPDSSDFGYRYFSHTSQQVLIPAFIAAYSGKTPGGVDLDYKPKWSIPNWQFTYDGLTKIDFFKKFFQSAVVNHAYRSSYTVGNISTNLLRDKAIQDDPDKAPLDNNKDLLPEDQISNVAVSEQFAPLLGLNVKLKNSATLRLEYRKDRNVSLSLANNQVTETKGSEWVIGAGYIIKDVRLKFLKLGSRRTSPVSNLELKADVGIRDNITIIRRIVEQSDQVTAGQKLITGKLSADYQISKRVTAKLFYDLNLSRYKTSNAFPITTHNFGLSVRLNLGQ